MEPVAYFSRKLTGPERNYAITELVEHFGHYLVGKHFVVTTDHKALEALRTSKHLTGRLARWALSLQHLNYTVQYEMAFHDRHGRSLKTLPRTSIFKEGEMWRDDSTT